jgi:hypothetical protein
MERWSKLIVGGLFDERRLGDPGSTSGRLLDLRPMRQTTSGEVIDQRIATTRERLTQVFLGSAAHARAGGGVHGA